MCPTMRPFSSGIVYINSAPFNGTFISVPRYYGLSLLRTLNAGPEGVRYNES